MDIQWQSYVNSHLPLLIIIVTGLVTMIAGLILEKGSHKILLALSLIGICFAWLSSYQIWALGLYKTGSDFLIVDRFSSFLYLVILLSGFFSCLSHYDYFEKQNGYHPEIYSLTLFALSGMMVMVSTTHLLLFFLALEVMSLAIYVLVGFKRKDPRSNEGAIKYFILGAMIAGFFLYGTALIYGGTAQLDLQHLPTGALPENYQFLLTIGVVLVIVSLGFKVAAVPFHFWTPDVYEGAPLSVTGFMATAVKAAAFGALLRFLFVLTPIKGLPTFQILQFLAIATLVVGNLVALYQTNIKRMLAYSSIAHAGYILVGVCATYAAGFFHPQVLGAPVFYLFAYSLMTLGAFAVTAAVAHPLNDNVEISHYNGLAERSPKLAAAMAVFMFALTGIPPSIGFAGKFFIFREAVHQGLYPLVIVGVLMSAVSAYYYLRVIVAMYFGSAPDSVNAPERPVVKPALAFVILFCLVSTLYMGLAPSRYLKISSDSDFISKSQISQLP